MNNTKSPESFKSAIGKADQKEDLVHISPDYIIEERNINSLPFFSPSNSGLKYKEHTYESSFRLPDGTEVSMQWRVSANVSYGFPSIKALNVHHAVIQIAMEHGFPIQNPIRVKLADICARIDIKNTPKNRKDIKNALLSIRFTAVWCKGAFWKDGKRSDLERGTTYYSDLLFYGDTDPVTGETITDTRISLADFLLESYNKPHARPIDFAYIKAIGKESPSAPNIYKVLGARFATICFSKNRGNAAFVRLDYHDYCSLIIANPQKTVKDAKKSLRKAHDALLKTHFFGQAVEWIGKGSDPHKYRLRFYPGKRARREYREGANSITRSYQLSLFPKPVIDTIENYRLSEMLKAIGFDADAISTLLTRYKSTEIELQIDHCLWSELTGAAIENKLGWISKALDKAYQPPKSYYLYKKQQELDAGKKARNQQRIDHQKREEAELEALRAHQATLRDQFYLLPENKQEDLLERIESDILNRDDCKAIAHLYKGRDSLFEGGIFSSAFYTHLEQELSRKG